MHQTIFKNDGNTEWMITDSDFIIFVINEQGFGYITPNENPAAQQDLEAYWNDFYAMWTKTADESRYRWMAMKG